MRFSRCVFCVLLLCTMNPVFVFAGSCSWTTQMLTSGNVLTTTHGSGANSENMYLGCKEKGNGKFCDSGDIVEYSGGLKQCAKVSETSTSYITWQDYTPSKNLTNCANDYSDDSTYKSISVNGKTVILRKGNGVALREVCLVSKNSGKKTSTNEDVQASETTYEQKTEKLAENSDVESCKVGEKDKYGFYMCDGTNGCDNEHHPSNATKWECKNVGRTCNVCVATECQTPGYVKQQGWCKESTNATLNEEATIVEEKTETQDGCPDDNWDGEQNTCDCGENATWNATDKKCERKKNDQIYVRSVTPVQGAFVTPENFDVPIVPSLPDAKAPEAEKTKELANKLKTAQDALSAARDKENSLANRAVSAVSTAATGLGAMEAASALAEQKADTKAEAEMREYISTMKCGYGKGQQFNLGTDEITLPGGNELLEYYTEYKTLADNLKTTKAALGLRPGIESEVLYDRAESGLYQYSNAERQSGGEASLFRALTDTEGADATAWNEQKDATNTKLMVGGGAAAVGVAGGAIGNAAINTDMIQNIKDAFKK